MQTLRRDDGMNRKQVVYLADVIVKKTKVNSQKCWSNAGKHRGGGNRLCDETERKDGTIYTQGVIREVELSRGMRHR